MAFAIEPRYVAPRRRLIEALRRNGIHDERVLEAFESVPRHLFVPTGVRHRAYEDSALPIGSGQTISQPSIHARYLQLLELKGTERVLEIGTGSGYQTALLAKLCAQVFTIERIKPLLDLAMEILSELEFSNIAYLAGDGTLGWRAYAPYDAILVSAGSPDLPEPLVSQLGEGGRMLIPIGPPEEQVLEMIVRRGEALERQEIAPVRFVPLLGAHGWGADATRRPATE
ncbi:MAG TPA: protein-L-isoaspartate(D-aspartate) O-methyltransferase [Gemmatimonadales bacterium]|nr:protein-L-isoaspartate(D-aspartate) O-methyltransferase [Gemmatimonadales bacterium]